ncbi:MAG TPA: alpha/beta hydrolase [Woeseiaceae bacterium]|nr:alpha/beta hydrolase [Woeseiaceae bacterium]
MTVEVERWICVAGDGRRILVDYWPVEKPGRPAGVIHILHGLGEHPARYHRFAMECGKRGYAVVAHNHRGHGENCAADELGHFADRGGWDLVISDIVVVQKEIRRRHPDPPLILLGHSMGSFIAQDFLMRHPQNAAALMLSGSSLPARRQLLPGHWIARFLSWRPGPRQRSALLNGMTFAAYNRRFAPNRTAFDWLSRDETEVDRYIADPLCGADSSNRLWADLIGALLRVRKRRSIRRIPPQMPVLITGGEKDPVGGQKAMTRLADAYRDTGHSDVTLKVYPDGRHEMLNELNRDEFMEDVLRWIDDNIP